MNLVTFTEEILNEKLYFLCGAIYGLGQVQLKPVKITQSQPEQPKKHPE